MKKLISLFMASMMCVSLFTGCGEQKKDTADSKSMTDTGKQNTDVQKAAKLTWMHHFNEEGAMKWMKIGTDNFIKTNPKVSFDIVTVSGGEYTQLLRTKMASGDMPDIYMIDNINSSKEFIDAGYAVDLSGQAFIKNNIMESALAGATLNGKIWCEPIDTNGFGVTYNKDVFAKAGIKEVPKTYKEFMNACEKIKQSGVTPIGAAYKDGWPIGCDIYADVIQTAVKYDPNWKLDIESGKAKWSEDKGKFKEALTRMGERFAYINNDPFGTDWNKATEMLATGKVAMIINGTWTVDAARSKKSDVNLGLFAFPWSDNAADNKFPLKATGGIAVNAKSPNKEMAVKVLEYFSSQEMGKVFQDNKKAISVIKGLKIDFDPAFADIEAYIKANNTVNFSAHNPDFVADEYNKLHESIITKFLMDKNRDVDKYMKMADDETAKIASAKK